MSPNSPNLKANENSELFVSTSSNAVILSEGEADQGSMKRNRADTAHFNLNDVKAITNKLESSHRTISIEDISEENKKSAKQFFDFITDQNPPASMYGPNYLNR
jgi:hypothetical protein